jgi:hypothetical protein
MVDYNGEYINPLSISQICRQINRMKKTFSNLMNQGEQIKRGEKR